MLAGARQPVARHVDDAAPHPEHLQRALAEQLGEPAGRHVAAEVHLEEPVLRVRIALREEQVLRIIGIDLGYALVVALDVDRAVDAA